MIVFNEYLWPFLKQLEIDHLTPNKGCLRYTIVATLQGNSFEIRHTWSVTLEGTPEYKAGGCRGPYC